MQQIRNLLRIAWRSLAPIPSSFAAALPVYFQPLFHPPTLTPVALASNNNPRISIPISTVVATLTRIN
jgi:hypothetical protein